LSTVTALADGSEFLTFEQSAVVAIAVVQMLKTVLAPAKDERQFQTALLELLERRPHELHYRSLFAAVTAPQRVSGFQMQQPAAREMASWTFCVLFADLSWFVPRYCWIGFAHFVSP
jgi:hypothetical protein